MNLQDRIKQIGGITSKQTSVLNHNDYTPQTYYSGIDSKVMYIDTLDALIETIMEYYIHTMLVTNNPDINKSELNLHFIIKTRSLSPARYEYVFIQESILHLCPRRKRGYSYF